MEENNNFKNVGITTKSNSRGVLVPFLSGVIGACLVMAVCFGVPEIKSKILDVNRNYFKCCKFIFKC